MNSITLSEKDIARFWSKVDVRGENDCWEWKAHTNNKGYGVIGVGCDLFLVHRVSYTIHNGPISKGMLICHKCDNRKCANPKHLFPGTNKENIIDMIQKGRRVQGEVYRGEKNKTSKLSDADVPKIRELYDSGISTHKIAKLFGVTSKAIWYIGKRVTWLHVKEAQDGKIGNTNLA